MFKKLRIKIVFLIMVVSGAILISFFAVMMVTNYALIIRANYNMLKSIIATDTPEIFFEDDVVLRRQDSVPYFTTSVVKIEARYNGENLFIEVKNEFMLKMDSEKITDIANDAMIKETEHSFIPEYNVRYYKVSSNDPQVATIAICSCDMESHYILRTMGISWILLVVGLAIIFLVSLAVSKSLTRPAETAWRQQQQFVADVSHELKTPLSVIIANNNILLKHKDEKIEDKLQWINSTKTEAEQMNVLINDMMYLTKSDARLLKNEKTVFDFSELVMFAILPFDSIAFEKKIVIETDIAEGIKIKACEQEIKTVISVIMDNAVKYSYNNKSIKVSLKTVKNKVEFKVVNFGDVIDEKEIPLIFERFYRGDKSRSKAVTGFGLGLSIAKNMVTINDGVIKCESSEEGGTIFTITFFKAE
ncbi:MAG: HAMP domain-containing histidine kinase [Clostridia bacterium]|nr:HAMP domain-containing histidine kinase [Clostridia bacterium]